LGTPSAPPIAGGEEEVMFDAVGENIRLCDSNSFDLTCPGSVDFIGIHMVLETETAEMDGGLEGTGVSSVADILAQDAHELPTR